jgi:hypothetical protein
VEDSIIAFLMVGGGISVALGSYAWAHHRAAKRLGGWAAANGYQLVAFGFCRHRGFYDIRLWNRNYSKVYSVTILDQRGARRTGYVLFGSWLFGMWSKRVEDIWDPA